MLASTATQHSLAGHFPMGIGAWDQSNLTGGNRFRDFERNGLPRLFEKFVFNFYRRELPEWSVNALIFKWQVEGQNEQANALLPHMKTDVCLHRSGRAIILDTKFYAQALQSSEYGSARLPPANLYQLFTYLRQRSSEPGWEQAEGVLLYPRTKQEFAVDFTTHGHRIRALTLELAQPWKQIHDDLMQIVKVGS